MRGIRTTVLGLLFWLVPGACTDTTDIDRLEISATGIVAGEAYLDLNGDGSRSAGDPPMSGVVVTLSTSSGAVPTIETVTVAGGAFVFEDVPVGRYHVALAADVLADSLITVAGLSTAEVGPDGRVELVLGVTYPEFTVGQIHAAEPGRRVFTSGIALNSRQPFSDGRVSIWSTFGGYLSATDVGRSTPSVSVGDSVRFLGTTAREFGRPILDDVTPFVLVQQARIPVPVQVSTGDAATASSGTLDGGLVEIRSAVVSEVWTVAGTGDVHFRMDDSSGSLEAVLRSFLQFPTRPIVGDTVTAVGLLAPFDDGSGTVRWRLLVRSPSELVLPPRP